MMKSTQIAGVILAGGKGSRMAYRDKPLLPLAGKPLIEHVIACAQPQVSELVISVNRNAAAYSYLERPLVSDTDQPYAGPLVGIYSAMLWLQSQRTACSYSHLACFAADVPRFPANLVARLAAELTDSNSQVAMAKTGSQLQPLFSLWSLASHPVLATALADKLYGPKLVIPRLKTVAVQFGDSSPTDFLNVNTPADLAQLEQLLIKE